MVALVPLVTNFDLRMQRNVVPFEDAAAAVVAGLCILALGFGIAVSLKRVYLSGVLAEAMHSTVKISAMVFVILLGASVFALVFRGRKSVGSGTCVSSSVDLGGRRNLK